ncbi:MAG: nitroreductase/quinone reductase family protein [Pseudomonadales bacterium]
MSNYQNFGKFHTWLYRISGGLILGSVGSGRKILLLTTLGRKSGQQRTTPLVYMAHDEQCVIYGSNGGRENPPAWLLNLQAEPNATIEIGRKKIPVQANIAEDEQRSRLLPLAHAYNAHWKGYQENTKREIPLIVLTPA